MENIDGQMDERTDGRAETWPLKSPMLIGATKTTFRKMLKGEDLDFNKSSSPS